jgi:hypothetical protein
MQGRIEREAEFSYDQAVHAAAELPVDAVPRVALAVIAQLKDLRRVAARLFCGVGRAVQAEVRGFVGLNGAACNSGKT